MAKGRMMVYRLYVDDLEGGTQYMSNEEFGAYMRLLHYQFRYGSVPEKDFENIVNRGLTAVEPQSNQYSEKNAAHAKLIVELLKSKFELTSSGYINNRMQDTRNEAIAFSERQSDKGKKSKPQLNRGSTVVEPIGNGKGNLGKGGVGEKPFNPADPNDPGQRRKIWNQSTAPDPRNAVIDPEILRRRGIPVKEDKDKPLNDND